MKQFCFTLPLLLIAFFSQAQTATKNLNSTEQLVWNKVQELHRAVFGSKDSAAIANLVSDRLHYGHSGGNIEDEALMIRNAYTNKTQYENVSNELYSITVVGNVAMVRLFLRAISVENEMPSPLDLGILQVWAKEGSRWLLLERQAVKVSKK